MATATMVCCALATAAAGDDRPVTIEQQPPAGAVATDTVILRFKPSATRRIRGGLRRLAGVRAGEHIDGVPGLEIAPVAPGEQPALAASRLAASEQVEYAHPNYVHSLSLTPNDTHFGLLWGLLNTGQDPDGAPAGSCPSAQGCAAAPGSVDADTDATEAWDTFAGGPAVVAVADSGIDDDHEDLNDNVWSNTGESGAGKETNGVDDDGNGLIDDTTGWDWQSGAGGCTGASSGDNVPDPPNWSGSSSDRSFHGSHVASSAGAEVGNGAGVAGVNPGTRLMNLRIGSTSGLIEMADELCAMAYAAAHGAKVYNGSYGGPSNSESVSDFVSAHPEILFVFSAGNSGDDNDLQPQYPCALPQVNLICVAASDNLEQLASFSNFGRTTVDLAAPGRAILGAINNATGDGYAFASGTSMAAPHVSGAASLLFARQPTLSAAQVRLALLAGVDQAVAYSCTTVTGGRLNVAKSLAIADSLAVGGAATVPAPNCQAPTPPPSVPASDTSPPVVSLAGANRGGLPRTGRFGFTVECDESCGFAYRVRVPRVGSFTGSGTATQGLRSKVTVLPNRRARRALMRRLRRGTVNAVVSVGATDASGNAASPARLSMLLRRR